MDTLAIIGIISVLVGIVAGIVQILDYVQKRRHSRDTEFSENPLPVLLENESIISPEQEQLALYPGISTLRQSFEPTIPHNLPRRAGFVGREMEKSRIHKALLAPEVFAVSIDGIGGIGKSALALEVAHECLEVAEGRNKTDAIAQFKGFVWATAKASELTIEALLDRIARALEYPGIAQQSLPDKRESVKKLLRATPYLIIIDNFETITDREVINFARALPSPSKILITTRPQNLDWTYAVSLKGLSQAEAFTLILQEGQRLGIKALENAEDAILTSLYRATGGAPLAIRWAVGQIKYRGQALESILSGLYAAQGDIFEDLFSRSWSLMSPQARQVLLVMPLFIVPAEREAIAAASGLQGAVLDKALGQAVELWLIEATDDLTDSRRYTIHPLTRSFAQRHLSSDRASENQARLNLARFYNEKGCKLQGTWGEVHGFPWFEVELPNIISVIEWLNQNHEWEILISIFKCCIFFLGTAGYWDERVRLGKLALNAAQVSDDQYATAQMLDAMGWTLLRQGHFVEAEAVLESSKNLYLDLRQQDAAAWVMIAHAKMEVLQGNLEKARAIVEEVTELVRETDDLEKIARGLVTTRGRIELQSGNSELARSLIEEALELTIQGNFGISIGSRQIDLGEVALAQNALDEAEIIFLEGLSSSEQYLRQDNIALAHFGLARVYSRRGKDAEAKRIALVAKWSIS